MVCCSASATAFEPCKFLGQMRCRETDAGGVISTYGALFEMVFAESGQFKFGEVGLAVCWCHYYDRAETGIARVEAVEIC